MNRFVPLLYVRDTLTVWHLSIWLAVPVLIGVVMPLRAGRPVLWAWLPAGLSMLAMIYAVLAILFGQLFGDTFALWFLPRAASLGLFDFPEFSWAVHLYRGP